MKATGFIKRHDRLGRSTSLSLELENSLETTVHLIIWVPDPILFTWQCLSILSLFFSSISWMVSKSNAHSREIRKENEETKKVAQRHEYIVAKSFVLLTIFRFRNKAIRFTKEIIKLHWSHTHVTHVILKVEKVGNLKLFVNFSTLALWFPVSFYKRNLELLLKKFSVSKEEKLC